MIIKQHVLRGENVRQDRVKSYSVGKKIEPKAVVWHYTAGWSVDSCLSAFRKRKVSSQLVIGRDGDVVQATPMNARAWHAGPSRWQGLKDLNSHSIGIEVVNIGPFKRLADGKYVRGSLVVSPETFAQRGYNPDNFEATAYPKLGSGIYYFPDYSPEQIQACADTLEAILKYYPGIRECVTHEEIDTRGWKTDPGPTFPLKMLQAMVNPSDRQDANAGVLYKVMTRPLKLNARGGPGTDYQIIGEFARGTELEVVGIDGKWLNAEWWADGVEMEGWVHGGFIDRIW